MQEISTDDLVRSMSSLWQKHLAVTETLAALLKQAGKNAENLISRTWRPLHELKKKGLAELEYDGPVILCRLTPVGSARKAQLSEPQTINA